MAVGIVVAVWWGTLLFSSPWHIDLSVAMAKLYFAIEELFLNEVDLEVFSFGRERASFPKARKYLRPTWWSQSMWKDIPLWKTLLLSRSMTSLMNLEDTCE
jgi:hypothetical protein